MSGTEAVMAAVRLARFNTRPPPGPASARGAAGPAAGDAGARGGRGGGRARQACLNFLSAGVRKDYDERADISARVHPTPSEDLQNGR